MSKKILVRVTKDDIKRGKREDMQACPIARSLKRLGKRQVEVAIFGGISWGTNGYAKCPKEAKKFIRAFDRGRKVEPFKFYLEPIS
jgi:hypothetical protein